MNRKIGAYVSKKIGMERTLMDLHADVHANFLMIAKPDGRLQDRRAENSRNDYV